MPIGAKMYEDDKSEASEEATGDKKSDDKDEPIEGEVVDDKKD
jgi:hypothetical protein